MKQEMLPSTKKEYLPTKQGVAPVRNLSKGFFLVEVLLAGAVFVLLATAFIGAYLYGQESTALAGNRARAVLLAEEGLEAVRNIRDDQFSNLTNGTHGLAISGNQWVFSGTQDTSGIFVRQITISPVTATRKNVTGTVTWQQNPSRTGSVVLTTRLTKWTQ
jgi:Tfp pilus assembly protein PilV